MTRTGGFVESGKTYIAGEHCCDHLMPRVDYRAEKSHGDVTINLEVSIEQPSQLVIHSSGDNLEAFRAG